MMSAIKSFGRKNNSTFVQSFSMSVDIFLFLNLFYNQGQITCLNCHSHFNRTIRVFPYVNAKIEIPFSTFCFKFVTFSNNNLDCVTNFKVANITVRFKHHDIDYGYILIVCQEICLKTMPEIILLKESSGI